MNTSLYRAAWRWHFYAGLIILPVLVWLAVTGALYLYKPELEGAIYRDWIELSSPAVPMPAAQMVERISRETGGRVTQLTRPADADESWRATLETSDGTVRTAFIDPTTGAVLGITSEGGAMKTISELHSLAITGPIGNALVEIVAGWAIILAVTGFYLWWPRNRQRPFAVRGHPRERRFWRDVHGSAGALVGAVILFLAVTGMPWSIFWGEQLHRLVTANQWGQPKAPGARPSEVAAPHEGSHGGGATDQRGSLPWSMQGAHPPQGAVGGDVGPDRVLAVAREQGLAPPYTVNLSLKAGAPYSVSRIVNRPADIRLIYVDPASGRVLQNVSFADFGPGAKAVEWSIYTHQGQTYGETNRLVMLTGCIGILLLAVSAPVLWWKRRRGGRLQAPPLPAEPAHARGLVATIVVLGILYPLTGATMAVAAAADRWLLQRRRLDAT